MNVCFYITFEYIYFLCRHSIHTKGLCYVLRCNTVYNHLQIMSVRPLTFQQSKNTRESTNICPPAEVFSQGVSSNSFSICVGSSTERFPMMIFKLSFFKAVTLVYIGTSLCNISLSLWLPQIHTLTHVCAYSSRSILFIEYYIANL